MPRPEGMKSYDYLAQELEVVGLTAMAQMAREKYYHDFFSPLATPELQLLNDLMAEIKKAHTGTNVERYNQLVRLRERHIDGEFDSTAEESEEWAKSGDGSSDHG